MAGNVYAGSAAGRLDIDALRATLVQHPATARAFLKADIVIVVEVAEPDNLITAFQQTPSTWHPARHFYH